jgi:hypothetical protein
MSVKSLSFQYPLLSSVTKAATMLLLFAGMVGRESNAQTAGGSVVYRLKPDSNFQYGCFPPCLCPVMVGVPVSGTFLLIQSGFDPLFTTYNVSNVNWSFSIDGTTTAVTGSGTYKIGGEFALEQELSLKLQLGETNVGQFDSGLVPISAAFPDINVSISTNHQYCFDAVFGISASPAPVPQLQVSLMGTNAIALSWSESPGTFVLQESSDLTNWSTLTNASFLIGKQNQVILPRSTGNKAYRLQPGS